MRSTSSLLARCAYAFVREQCDVVAAIVLLVRLRRGRQASVDVESGSCELILTRSENV